MSDDSRRCLKAGCDEFLSKPIARAKLIQAIGARVGRQGAAGETAEAGNEIVSELASDPDIATILPGFISRLGGQLETMREAQAAGDHDGLRRLAHKLKGAGGSYGYPTLTEACAVLEETASTEDRATVALDTVAALIHDIQSGYESVSTMESL